jgi:protein-L-isoaspartate(D-aspartate) O-methyltransferase
MKICIVYRMWKGCIMRWTLILLIMIGLQNMPALSQDETKFEALREQMIRSQIESRGIKSPSVLDALRAVKRHLFVPENVRNQSYDDGPLPIGEGQTISQPYIVAIMTDLLDVNSTSRVLEIGTGSGYQAAVLGEICKEVYSIEIVDSLCNRARTLLSGLGYTNIWVRCGDGFAGWPDKAPFDGIIVTAAPPEVPAPLIDQLAEGGRLVIPVGSIWQELKVLVKENGKIRTRDIIPVRFVPMTGEAQKSKH